VALELKILRYLKICYINVKLDNKIINLYAQKIKTTLAKLIGRWGKRQSLYLHWKLYEVKIKNKLLKRGELRVQNFAYNYLAVCVTRSLQYFFKIVLKVIAKKK